VKQLTVLSTQPSYLDRFIAIRDAKRDPTKSELTDAALLIQGRYAALDQAFAQGKLEDLKRDVQAIQISKILRACYGGGTKPLSKLKEAIEKAQPARLLMKCPMCGITLPGTFDHYLPAVTFPEFSVHPLNLVPCCSKCNSIKDDFWISNAGKRLFLHAYKDPIPDLQIVGVTLHEDPAFVGVGANFSVTRPHGIGNDLWNLIESHFRRLNLIARYDERGNEEIAEQLASCRSYRDAGGPDAGLFLANQANDRRQVHGRNHWIAVLMEAMSLHPNLSKWIDATKGT
jgi:hypothetical protein